MARGLLPVQGVKNMILSSVLDYKKNLVRQFKRYKAKRIFNKGKFKWVGFRYEKARIGCNS